MAASSDRTRVLATFAGRKWAWLEALASSSFADLVIGCDSDPIASGALRGADFARVPPADDERAYLDALLELCDKRSIDCLAPLNDRDLSLLAGARAEFTAIGTRVLTADPELVATLGDKLDAARFLTESGFATPPTLPIAAAAEACSSWGYPLLTKSRRGQGSAGVARIDSRDELERVGGDAVLQPFLDGEEFHLDVLRSAEGVVVAVVPKRKLGMYQGSTDKVETIDAPELVDLGRRLGERLRSMLGSVDVDVIRSCGRDYVVDVNLRLGGGFPFSALCAPGYVDALLAIGRGLEPEGPVALPRPGRRFLRDWLYCEVSSEIGEVPG